MLLQLQLYKSYIIRENSPQPPSPFVIHDYYNVLVRPSPQSSRATPRRATPLHPVSTTNAVQAHSQYILQYCNHLSQHVFASTRTVHYFMLPHEGGHSREKNLKQGRGPQLSPNDNDNITSYERRTASYERRRRCDYI